MDQGLSSEPVLDLDARDDRARPDIHHDDLGALRRFHMERQSVPVERHGNNTPPLRDIDGRQLARIGGRHWDRFGNGSRGTGVRRPLPNF